MSNLHWHAVQFFDISTWLIDHGADINERGNDGKDAAMETLYFFNPTPVARLLDHPSFKVDRTDKQGNTPLHCCFYKGIRRDGYPDEVDERKCALMFPIIKKLMKKRADPHQANNKGETPLSLAITTGYRPFVELLSAREYEIS